MSTHDNDTKSKKEDILEKQKGEPNHFTFTQDESENHKKIYGGDNIQDKSGFIKNSHEEQQLEAKRKKERDDTFKILVDADKAFDNLMSDIEDRINQYNASRERESRLNNALKNNDIADIKQILINDYHRNPNDVQNMDISEAVAAAEEYIKQERFTQQVLKHEIIELASQYDEEYGLTEDQRVKLQKLVNKSDIAGIDFDKSFSEIRNNLNSQFLIESDNLVLDDSLAPNLIDVGLTDPFNMAANNETTNPFDLEQEKSAPDPFSSAPASPNPFG